MNLKSLQLTTKLELGWIQFLFLLSIIKIKEER